MAKQSVENKYQEVNHYNKLPNINYEEIEGIKLRDSLFLVHSQDSLSTGPEFIFNLKPIEDTKKMFFENDEDSVLRSGVSEDCGIYELEDQRILKIETVNNWHYKGYIFNDEDSWREFKAFSK